MKKLIYLVFLIGILCCSTGCNDKNKEASDSVIVIEAPKGYTTKQAINEIKKRAKDNDEYLKVLDKINALPDLLIIDLANNEEILDFVLDYPQGVEIDKNVTDDELAMECPLFLQWDKRWGYEEYGMNGCIAINGCAPTALAMVTVALTGEKISPLEVANYADEKYFYIYGQGTSWELMTVGADYYGLESVVIDVDEKIFKSELDSNHILICSMRKGDFTTNGHFIVIYGYDSDGFKINDPFCKYRSSQRWTYDSISNQIKGVWSLSKKK